VATTAIGTAVSDSNTNSNGNASVGTDTGAAASGTNTAANAGPGDTGAEPPGPSNLELDRLAANLYDRIASRLRTELRLDRERVGLLTDIHR
jgi:hypothetical protein